MMNLLLAQTAQQHQTRRSSLFLWVLRELETIDAPLLHPNVRALTGKLQGDFRLRVGKWRILFTPHIEKKIIYVFAIVPRGGAY